MKKKAVSPVIATILLISIVVVIAAIIFFWFRGFTQEAIIKNGENAELVCKDVSLSASYSDGELSISNTGNVPVTEIQVKIQYETDSTTETFTSENMEGNLGVGGAAIITTNLSGATKVIVVPVLKGMTSKGETNFVCDQNGIEASPENSI